MKNLRKKTFFTIFAIISLFAFLFAILFNVLLYQREYQEIINNIARMQNYILDKNLLFINDQDLYNRKVMDYEIYTFILDEKNNIIVKISHSDTSINNEIVVEANKILTKNKKSRVKIGNLYLNNYAYNLKRGNFLTIVKIANTRKLLLATLFISIFLIVLGEIAICFLAKKITDWITKPVLESFSREKEFVANASHELKTPLAVMMASIDCLSINKKNEKWINNLKSESDRMSNLITRLLDLSKTETYLTKENFVSNDLSMIVEKRALTFESLAYEKNVTIEMNVKEKINFLCHKESIDELVSILIDNAIKHSKENSKIQINLSKNKTEIKLEVINEGEEIPVEEREKIFERFYRNDKSHNRKEGRYGLGLAIAKNIVEGHNGKIKAFSKDGFTTFEIIFKIVNFNNKI